ncbi:protein phosphatase 2C domain-containing protein, partial [Candidatus Babeliales bacterium]|nr:protein phosphatase 2C domain-containing protein [Candidatus Babeliales bacterium]
MSNLKNFKKYLLLLSLILVFKSNIFAFKIEFDTVQILGTRETQEDRFTQIINEDFSLFLICDGHGLKPHGDFVSNYLSQNLLNKIINNQYFNQFPEMAFLQSFEQIDREILDLARQNNIDSGSTATVVLIKKDPTSYNNTVYFAWVGDSPAILYNTNGNILLKTIDHKLCNEREATRIGIENIEIYEDDNNYPSSDRIGQVNMSRSIGDRMAKAKKSIAIPEMISCKIPENQSYFIVISSDGLFDKYNYLEDTFFESSVNLAAEELIRSSQRTIFQAALLNAKSQQFQNLDLSEI